MESRQVLVDVPAAASAAVSEQTQKLSLFALTMMVVGSMVGAGIWSLPRPFATATGVFGAIIAWLIAAGGMYTLARVFQALAERKPDLDAGVYAYAKAGFGDYLGFLSAIGYFFSACLGNTFYWVLIKSTLGSFFPICMTCPIIRDPVDYWQATGEWPPRVKIVIPASAPGSGFWPARGQATRRAGIQKPLKQLDSRFRGNDDKSALGD